MKSFSNISIIYNPTSTGPSKTLAQQLAKELRKTSLKSKVRIISTRYRGHAESIAYKVAIESPRQLIISSSGDGGYNEVINGVMIAQQEGAKAATGLLPAGNANDHFRYLNRQDTLNQILKGRVRKIDLIQITATNNQSAWTRYAHSYIGIGLTPNVGKELNKFSLNPFNEKWIALRAFFKLQPVRLRVRGVIKIYDSIIFANIGRMSKVLSLSDTASVNDGKFELITFKHQTRGKLVAHVFQAATKGLRTTNRRTEYSFKTIESISIQLDGEVSVLPAGTQVKITIATRALSCIV